MLRGVRAAGRAWDAAWLTTLARPGAADALHALAAAVDRLPIAAAASPPVCQRTRRLPGAADRVGPAGGDDVLAPPADGDSGLQVMPDLPVSLFSFSVKNSMMR